MTNAFSSFLDDVARLLGSQPGLLGVALLITLAGLLWRLYVNRKRIAYKVEFNSKIGIVPPLNSTSGIVPPFDPNAGGDDRRTATGDEATDLLRAFNSVSLVVIRVQNTGRAEITADDYAEAMRFVVPRDTRYIVDFRVSASTPDGKFIRTENSRSIDGLDVDWVVSDRSSNGTSTSTTLHRPSLRARIRPALMHHRRSDAASPETDAPHIRIINPHSRRQLTLPRFAMASGDQFDLVICLRDDDLHTDGAPSKDAEFHLALRKPSTVVDRNHLPRRPSGVALLTTLVAVLGLLLGLTLILDRQEPVQCGMGELRVVGSSAFAPTAERIIDQYESECSGASLRVAANGSLEGIREVQESGPGQGGPLAFSDGAATGATNALQSRPVAVLVYAVVANRGNGVEALTSEQVRQINSGALRSWSQLGGADLPIRIVARGSDSGSRQAFEKYVLGGPESPLSSNGCQSPDRVPGATVTRCERPSTRSLLEEVNRTPGAVGYADAALVADFPGVQRLRLDGLEATSDYLARGYGFWTIEYAYSDGVPPGGSLLDRFVGYLSDDKAARILREDYYIPCVRSDRSIESLCQQNR